MAGKLPLKDVTLVYLSDATDHNITTRSLQKNLAAANFGEVILFSDAEWRYPGCTSVKLPPFKSDVGTDQIHAIGAVMCALWYAVPKYIKTSHFLIAQWDSWIINPARWTPHFLDYDYIGGPWHRIKGGRSIFEVGNGGFCIRSTALAQHVAANPDKYPLTYPRFEDGILCRDHRVALEAQGFTWAPVDLAARFSFEGAGQPNFDMSNPNYIVDFTREPLPFGYHAMRNWPHIMPRDELAEMLGMVRPGLRQHRDYAVAMRALGGMPRGYSMRPAPSIGPGISRAHAGGMKA